MFVITLGLGLCSHLGKCKHCVHGYKLCSWCVAHLGAQVDIFLFTMQEIAIEAVMITTIRAAIATIIPTSRPSMLTGGVGGGPAKEQTNTAQRVRLWGWDSRMEHTAHTAVLLCCACS